MVLCVLGLSSLGEPADKLCFRVERAEEIVREHGRPDFKADGQGIFCPGDLTCLMQYGYLYPLRIKYPSIPVIPVFNQADGPETAALAGGLLEGMRESRGIAVGNLRSDPCVELF